MINLSIDKIKWGGLYHYFFWDQAFNPLATIEDCLANCTCFVIGDCGVTGTPRPVSRVVGAKDWHLYLANDWTCLDFSPSRVKVGDIIQWVKGNHVARVFKIENGEIWVRGSFYTGENGKSMLNGGYDTRERFKSLQEVSEFMEKNYPSRLYHECKLSDESKACGADPEHILSMPNFLEPVDRNESVNQIQTFDDTLRIRTEPNLNGSIVGHVMIGFYNVLDIVPATNADKKTYKEQKGEDLKEWYEIAKDRWCANVTTEYLPKKADTDISKAIEIIVKACKDLQDENNRYKEAVKQAVDILNKVL